MDDGAPFDIRLATAADAGVIARYRAAMFVEMGSLEAGTEEAAAIVEATERLLLRALPAGEWVGWIAEDSGGTLGSGCAVIRTVPPGPGSPTGGAWAHLLNVYTEPAARRRGVATALVRASLAWAYERRFARITLHASAAGRRVYERLGFAPREGEMIWDPHAAERG